MHQAGGETRFGKPRGSFAHRPAGAAVLSQDQLWRAPERGQSQIDELHALVRVCMSIGAAVPIVKRGGERGQCLARDLPVGEWHGQLVGLPAITDIGPRLSARRSDGTRAGSSIASASATMASSAA